MLLEEVVLGEADTVVLLGPGPLRRTGLCEKSVDGTKAAAACRRTSPFPRG